MVGRKYNRRHRSSLKLKRNTKTREQHVFNSLPAESGKNTAWELGQHCSFSLTALVICLSEREPDLQFWKEGAEGFCGSPESGGERRVGGSGAQGQEEVRGGAKSFPSRPWAPSLVLRGHPAQVSQVVSDRFGPPRAGCIIPAPAAFGQRKDAGASFAFPASFSS
ncbi:unnamed protein product [Pipistrellus nathusii]|uniref:Uncharacterized protein n=1 Tax=Pipistrellus nathusii TaxID=59473 RepID=A0ABP0AJU9_PIPNA